MTAPRGGRWLRALMCASALLAVAIGAGGARQADAALYWSTFSAIGRANLDGSAPLWPLPNGWFPALEAGSVCGLAVDGSHIYWGDTSNGSIDRATLDGTEPNLPFIGGLTAPCGVAVDGSHVYWADLEANMIGRANLDGSDVEPGFIVGAAGPCGIAVDGSHVFWANLDGGTIGRAALEGSEVDERFISGLSAPCGIALTSGGIYWGSQGPPGAGAIGRANLDGTGVEQQLITGVGEPWAVATDGSHLYWADRRGGSANPSGVGRAGLDGTEVNYDLIPSVDFPTGLALDARSLSTAPPPPQASDYLRFGKLTHYRRNGVVQLVVYVPARGDFRIDSPQIGWSIDKGNPPPWVAGTFRWKLKLWPGKGSTGLAIRRRLSRLGRATVTLNMTYQQEGRLPLQESKRVTFVHRVRRSSGISR